MLEITPTDISEILKYVFDLFSDFKLLIFLMIGMFLGFWILETIISILRKD